MSGAEFVTRLHQIRAMLRTGWICMVCGEQTNSPLKFTRLCWAAKKVRR